VDVALGTSDGVVGSADDLRSVLESYFTSFGIPATTNSHWAGATPTNFEIGSLETSGHAGSSIVISNVISTFPGNFAMGFENSPDILDHDNMYPQGTLSFDGPFSIGPRATVTFDVEVGTSGRRTVVIDQSSVSQALGTYGGEVNTADELAQVIQFVAGPAGLHVTANGVNIEFAADRLAYPDAGNRAANVYLGNVQFNEGGVLDFDLDEVDIAIPGSDLDRYLRGIDLMIERVVDAGSMIGSLQTRIDIQRSFTDYLIDGTRKGISRLIDADMTEASSRLKAFQAQHELALQSLSLANAGSRVLLQLFDA
jgi:flagellin